MFFENRRASSSKLYAKLGLLKFADMVECENVLLLHKIFHNMMPLSVQDTFAVDFSHIQDTRAEKTGLINLHTVNLVCFGKDSIKFNAINSWNRISLNMENGREKVKDSADDNDDDALLKLISLDYFTLKRELKKFFITSY